MAEGRIESYTPEEFLDKHDKKCSNINFDRVAEEYLKRFDKIDENDKPKLKKAGADLLKAIPVAWAGSRWRLFDELLFKEIGDRDGIMGAMGEAGHEMTHNFMYDKVEEGLRLNGMPEYSETTTSARSYISTVLECIYMIKDYRSLTGTKSCKKRKDLQEGLGTD